jgi:hypothetical protein
VHHQLAEALEPRDVPFPRLVTPVGRGPQIIGPLLVLEWFWKPLEQLPGPERRDAKGQAGYVAELAGRPARHALDRLDMLLPR